MKLLRSFVLWWLAASIVLVSAVQAQGNAPSSPPPFKAEELDALLAPIALYPDSLLTQILMASTYPLEVVQAARWSKANPKLSGDAALRKVENESWDVSVKSLVAFPNVLEMMNEKLDWTQKLGDAFLAQQQDVMAAVQRLRQRAQANGHLESNAQQVVRTETQYIVIEPAQPQTIYVPAYNPTVVYGAWPYPTYPPYYYPGVTAWYPGGALVSGFAWGLGFAAAGAIYGGWNWGRGDVDINVNRATNIDRNFTQNNVNVGNKWQHNPQHRGNVGYRDAASRERYASQRPAAADRGEYRGRDGDRSTRDNLGGERGGHREAISDNRAGQRGGDRAEMGAHRDGLPNHGDFDRSNRSSERSNAFEGVGNGNRDLDRGRASTAQMQRSGGHTASGGGNYQRPSGGGSRNMSAGGGGGARAGGGGGGRGGRR